MAEFKKYYIGKKNAVLWEHRGKQHEYCPRGIGEGFMKEVAINLNLKITGFLIV